MIAARTPESTEGAPTRASPETRTRVRSIDGLRAVAILAVMGFHFGLGPQGGFLGVDLFFVISGFVITRTMIRERDRTGRVSLKQFWLRRVRRILPALVTVLFATLGWVALDGDRFLIKATSEQAIAASGFVSNWWQIFGSGGYWDVAAGQSPLTHLWSLAVEEQFYILFPLLFLVVFGVIRKYRWVAMATLAIASYVWAFMMANPQAVQQDLGILDRVYQGTDTRAGALLLGCAAAILPVKAQRRHSRSYTQKPQIVFASVALVALGLCWFTLSGSDLALYRGGLLVTGLAGATLIYLVSCDAIGPIKKVLEWKPVVGAGRMSYSLYLWHWPVWVFLERTPLAEHGFLTGLVAFLCSFVLAFVSYKLIELPVTHSGARWRVVAPASIIALGSVVGLSMWLLSTAPPPPSDGVVVSLPIVIPDTPAL